LEGAEGKKKRGFPAIKRKRGNATNFIRKRSPRQKKKPNWKKKGGKKKEPEEGQISGVLGPDFTWRRTNESGKKGKKACGHQPNTKKEGVPNKTEEKKMNSRKKKRSTVSIPGGKRYKTSGKGGPPKLQRGNRERTKLGKEGKVGTKTALGGRALVARKGVMANAF